MLTYAHLQMHNKYRLIQCKKQLLGILVSQLWMMLFPPSLIFPLRLLYMIFIFPRAIFRYWCEIRERLFWFSETEITYMLIFVSVITLMDNLRKHLNLLKWKQYADKWKSLSLQPLDGFAHIQKEHYITHIPIHVTYWLCKLTSSIFLIHWRFILDTLEIFGLDSWS